MDAAAVDASPQEVWVGDERNEREKKEKEGGKGVMERREVEVEDDTATHRSTRLLLLLLLQPVRAWKRRLKGGQGVMGGWRSRG